MALTTAKYKELVLRIVGDEEDTVLSQIDVIWELHSDKSPDALRYHHVVMAAIDLLAARNRQLFSFAEKDRRVDLDKKFDHLMKMRAQAQTAITSFNSDTLLQGVPAVGMLEAYAPVEATPGSPWPDPNDAIYRGDPTTWWRR